MNLRPAGLLLALIGCLVPPALAGQTGGGAPPGLTREPDFKLTASAGLAGQARMGWVPVYVAVEARREFDGDLVVQLRDPSSMPGLGRDVLFETRRPVKLPAGSKTEYHLFVRHDSPYLTPAAVEVRLDEDGRRLRETEKTVGLALVPQSNYFVCVLSDKIETLSGLRAGRAQPDAPDGSPREFLVAQPGLRELPDKAVGYEGVDFLVLHQTPFESLSKAQMAAIADHAWRGGVVVLAARDRSWFARPEVQALAPVARIDPAGRDVAGRLMDGLARKYGAWGADVSDAAVHAFALPGARDERGFATARCGLGHVLLWRLDPDHPAVRRWAGLPGLWADLGRGLYPGRLDSEHQPNYGSDGADAPAARSRGLALNLNMAEERMVPGLLLVFVVVLYLVLVGPVNYFTLRRLDMKALSIVTIPLLAAAFVLLNFAAGYLSRGVTTNGRRVTVALAASGATRADCCTWQAVFPAGSMLVDVSVDNRGLVMPLAKPREGYSRTHQAEAFSSADDERFALSRHAVSMWEMCYFEARSTRPLGGPVRLTALGGDRFEAANAGSVPLKACLVADGLNGRKFALLGDLPPGATRQVTLAGWWLAPGPGGPAGVPAPLPLKNALRLWLAGDLRADRTSYTVSSDESGFEANAAKIVYGDPRMEESRLGGRNVPLLFARAGEELEPLRLNGRTIGGENVEVLAVRGEPAPRTEAAP